MLASPALPLARKFALFVALLFATLSTLPAPALAFAGFGFSEASRRAEALAARAYAKPEDTLPKALRELNYEQYRDIRFKPERAHWRKEKLPFELAFFHPGRDYREPVVINEISEAGVRRLRYRADDFDFGANRVAGAEFKGLDFAGFRVHYPLNSAKVKDEVVVFLGASYFRALGRGQGYGLSARGVAVDTAETTGEEFPRFVEFWIERPAPGARALTIYALLDSPRLTGAYRFVVRPGVDTEIDVRARLFLRSKVAKLGIAPLTSMYYFGENQPAGREDYRPEVHDSDGLSIAGSRGEAIWRPLVNPKRLLVTSFQLTAPRGFGLQQRDRSFASYEDLGTRYEIRPGAWVEPVGDWGAGRVELVQIPTPDETNDNIVAYWVPAEMPAPRRAYDFAYRVLWQKDGERRPSLLWVAQTRRGPGYTTNKAGNHVHFFVDFAAGVPPRGAAANAANPAAKATKVTTAAPDEAADVRAAISFDGNAQLVSHRVEHHPLIGGYRLWLVVRRLAADKPVDLSAVLQRGDTQISETWSYILPAD